MGAGAALCPDAGGGGTKKGHSAWVRKEKMGCWGESLQDERKEDKSLKDGFEVILKGFQRMQQRFLQEEKE